MKKRVPYWIWAICGVFLIMQYLICLDIYLMGDDYMYGTYAHQGVFPSVFSYYFTGNGRWLVNILDCLCLYFDRILYVIFNPWLLLLLGFMLYRLISLLSGEKSPVVMAAALVLISVIGVLMTCEVFYWITGAMNYLIPALFLLASMCAVVKMRSGETSRKQRLAYALVCIVSCLTVEQFALMTIGWMLLIWGWDLIKTGRLGKTKLIVLLVSALGLATIVLAPANFVRIEAAAAKGSSLIVKTIDLIYYDYYSVVSSTLLFIIAAYGSYKLFCMNKRAAAVLSGFNALLLLFVFDYSLFPFRDGISLLLALVSILLSLITLIPYLFSLYKGKNLVYLISLFLIGFGSQLMLLNTDLWGFRTSFSWILLYLIVLLSMVADHADIKDFAVFACISCIAVNPYLGLMATAGLAVVRLKRETAPILALIFSILAIVVGLSDETLGYRSNGQIHEHNILALETLDDTTSHFIQKSNFIAYFHVFCY